MNTSNQNISDTTLHLTPQMNKIIDYINTYGAISDIEIEELLEVKRTRAYAVAKQLKDMNIIKRSVVNGVKKYIMT